MADAKTPGTNSEPGAVEENQHGWGPGAPGAGEPSGAYQPYPTTESSQQPQRVPPPRSVRTAVKLMYAGAALSAIAVIITLVTVGSLKSAIVARDPNYTSAQLHTAEVVGVASAVIGGLIAIGLWLWMAWANGRGQTWARIVSAVFFGINTLDLLLSIVRVHAAATLIGGIVVWLVGLGNAEVLGRADGSAKHLRAESL
jgi:hypothetical protein